MQFSVILATLAISCTCAYADVSHLSNRYLPPLQQQPQQMSYNMMSSYAPTAPRTTTTTEIEKQELRELPVQIEYMQQMPNFAPNRMPMYSQTMLRMPNMNYVQPSPSQQSHMRNMNFGSDSQRNMAMPSQYYMPAAMQQPTAMSYMSRQPSAQYLPPMAMPQMQNMNVNMYATPMRQYEAPNMAAMPNFMPNTYARQPAAGMLTDDGYHYQPPAVAAQRFRLRH